MTKASMILDKVAVRFPIGTDWRGRPRGHVHALNGVDLTAEKGRTLGIVGESGCGKTTLAQIMMGILSPSEGKVGFGASTSPEIQIVFQDPQSSLNARMPVWRVITEPVFAREKKSRTVLRDLAMSLAEKVGIRPEALDRYPHEFSGGQRQRIAIARALSSNPDIIILDEPTSALDISIQAQILNLLKDLQRERGLTYIFISHDISVVRYFCDDVAVMYLGQVVESGRVEHVLDAPRHPYTALLLESVPRMKAAGPSQAGEESILGVPLSNTDLPSNRNLPKTCFFHDRCEIRGEACRAPQDLKSVKVQATHLVRCCQVETS